MHFYISQVVQQRMGFRMSSDNNQASHIACCIVLAQPDMFDAWILSFNQDLVQQYGFIAV